MKKIKEPSDINSEIREGQLLMAALAVISTTSMSDKTPGEIIEKLNDVCVGMYPVERDGLPFGDAIIALKQGKRVARKGWNGKGLFIFMQVPAKIDVITTVPKMQSLPQSVKDCFVARACTVFDKETQDKMQSINYKNQLAMVYPDNTIYGWVASPSDVLEEDWVILD